MIATALAAPFAAAAPLAATASLVLAGPGDTVANGSLLLAVPLAFAAGVVSFLSPCVLPLVPGYLSYITGLTGAELAPAPVAPSGVGTPSAGGTPSAAVGTPAPATATPSTATATAVEAAPVHRRSRVVLGTLLFVAGFSVVFVAYGALFGTLGNALIEYGEQITRVLGLVVIILGLMFMGLLPGLTREYRFHRAPSYGIWGAPVLGVLFGLGWTPCIGPTLAAVQSLAFTEASAARGALLSLVYCLGLGLPFLIVGLAFRRAMGALGWVKRHYLLVMRIGGGLLVLIGLMLVTGYWNDLTIAMRTWVSGFSPAL